jgi:hypothetical protein
MPGTGWSDGYVRQIEGHHNQWYVRVWTYDAQSVGSRLRRIAGPFRVRLEARAFRDRVLSQLLDACSVGDLVLLVLSRSLCYEDMDKLAPGVRVRDVTYGIAAILDDFARNRGG